MKFLIDRAPVEEKPNAVNTQPCVDPSRKIFASDERVNIVPEHLHSIKADGAIAPFFLFATILTEAVRSLLWKLSSRGQALKLTMTESGFYGQKKDMAIVLSTRRLPLFVLTTISLFLEVALTACNLKCLWKGSLQRRLESPFYSNP